MDWMDEVKGKIKRGNQVLFSKDGEYLVDLAELIKLQSHKAMVLWAFDFADETAQKLLESYPLEQRPAEAVNAAKNWAAGKVKMPVAKRAILRVHGMAKEIHSEEAAALCHAIGQACGVVHGKGHAMGFPVYDLTAVVRRFGVGKCREHVEKRKAQYIEKMNFWSANCNNFPREWAAFMQENR